MFYHIHRKGICDEIWHTGSNITVSSSFQSDLGNFTYVEDFLKRIFDNNYDIDEAISIFSDKELVRFIGCSSTFQRAEILANLYFYRREMAMEEARKKYAPHAPSRMHCLYLTDESDLPYWQGIVGDGQYEIFEIDASGNIFATSDYYLPNMQDPYAKQLISSKTYWNPTLIRLFPKEYLFQGTCHVLKRIK